MYPSDKGVDTRDAGLGGQHALRIGDASARLAAATTASPGVECRPTRPVRADPPEETIRTTTGTTTINPAKGAAVTLRGASQVPARFRFTSIPGPVGAGEAAAGHDENVVTAPKAPPAPGTAR
jgi:hypothetical protein